MVGPVASPQLGRTPRPMPDGVTAAVATGTRPVRMRGPALPGLALACLLAAPGAGAIAQDAAGDEVTIYRCTGADGQVSIGNVPCADGTREEVRSMVRPQDAPPASASASSRVPPRAGSGPPPAPTVVVQQVAAPPQPLYECVRPDGSVYESDSGQGEVRWRPGWTSGWPIGWRAGGPRGHGGTGGPPAGRGDIGARGPTTRAGSGLSAPPVSRISLPPDPPRPDPGVGRPPRPRPPHGGWAPADPGTLERDPCHVLPQAETCGRLRDRREELRRRFFNAQQRERDTLRVEERGLNARIDRDCRAY